MEIWPAIDLRGGKCVRLRQGDYGQETVFGDYPAKMAQHWYALGARRLHLVDLDGAKDGRPTNLEAVRAILAEVCPTTKSKPSESSASKASSVPMICELGGGIRSGETIRALLEIGLQRLVVGTLALKQPEWFCSMCEKFPQKMVLGIDAKDGFVATDGWLEVSVTPAIELAKQFDGLPLAAIVYTDIATDGMMQGPNVIEMAKMQQSVNVPVVASGGVTTLDDVRRLKDAGLAAAIIGRALYEGTIRLPDALRIAE
ncbi:MAG: 1-(5-phosphoribosyl)-5-[(5-phosphoribosylamino)methylideneamino] imidazole-4-carboxamide isomerase [Thermoguttaceae bacterium]|nr:1-(5-phosphoribosyl)-5-[(5-phosphoribosylamino)methylideneamino] imidazole-4-carboxamide isomerase [Thermoguttaceae bacterium]